MKLVTKADVGQWVAATTAYEKIMAKAATLAMRAVGKKAVTDGRRSMAQGGFSANFQRQLRAINKPKTGYVLNPAVYVHTRVNYADVFEKGRTIHGNPFLWLPFPRVPKNPGSGTKFGGLVRRDHMTPSQYVRKVGPLITIKRPDGLPWLAAEVIGTRITPKARLTRQRLRRTRALAGTGVSRKEIQIIPMFHAVREIVIPPGQFDVTGAIHDAAEKIDEFYLEFFEPYEGRR